MLGFLRRCTSVMKNKGELRERKSTQPQKQTQSSSTNKKRASDFSKKNNNLLGIPQKFWLIFFLLLSACVVVVLCIYGDLKHLDTNHWHANYVMKGLYIGEYKDVLNYKELKNKGITHIVTVAIGIEPSFPHEFKYMIVRSQDHSDQDLLSYLPTIHKFIDQGRKEGAVLVHCKAGQSRSAMVVTSYIMKEKSWNVFEALDFLIKARPSVKPRASFIQQLELFHNFHRKFDSEIINHVHTWPNKAQVSVWEGREKITHIPQPEWVVENFWRERWDAVVHHYMDFYNNYLKYYES